MVHTEDLVKAAGILDAAPSDDGPTIAALLGFDADDTSAFVCWRALQMMRVAHPMWEKMPENVADLSEIDREKVAIMAAFLIEGIFLGRIMFGPQPVEDKPLVVPDE